MKKPDLLMNNGQDNIVFDPKAKSSVKKTLKVNNLANKSFTSKYFLSHNTIYRLKCTWGMDGIWISNKLTLIRIRHPTSTQG